MNKKLSFLVDEILLLKKQKKKLRVVSNILWTNIRIATV